MYLNKIIINSEFSKGKKADGPNLPPPSQLVRPQGLQWGGKEVESRKQLYQIHNLNNSEEYHQQVATLVVRQATVIFDVFGLNHQCLYFL
jgi:hypothetical protein